MNKPLSPLSGLVRAMRIVGSAVFGVRDRKRHDEDWAALSPFVLVFVAVIFLALFVVGLVTLATAVASG